MNAHRPPLPLPAFPTRCSNRLICVSLFIGAKPRMMFRTLALVLAFSVFSSQAQTQSTPASTQQLPDAPSTTTQVKPPVVPTGPTAVIDTTMGRLTCKPFETEPT